MKMKVDLANMHYVYAHVGVVTNMLDDAHCGLLVTTPTKAVKAAYQELIIKNRSYR